MVTRSVQRSPNPSEELSIFGRSPVDKPAVHLDLVVPFTTPQLTGVALKAARRMGAGLDAEIRLVRVQVVPFPLDPDSPPVPVAFLEQQLDRLARGGCAMPTTHEIRLARDFEAGLLSTLRFRSLIVIASKKRPWRTRTERLAASLRLAGYTVVMVAGENENA